MATITAFATVERATDAAHLHAMCSCGAELRYEIPLHGHAARDVLPASFRCPFCDQLFAVEIMGGRDV